MPSSAWPPSWCAVRRRSSSVSMIRRGVPSTTFSSASVKSPISTCWWPRRAADRAASLTRLRRSAPTIPGVVAASAPSSTSGPTGTLRVWTSRIIRRPSWSGGLTATRRSNRPGRSSAESSTSGRLVAASTTTPSVPVKPSISVRIWLSVCSRSSHAADAAAAAGPADRVQLVDEDDRRGGLLRRVEQVADPGRADTDDHLDELGRRHVEERHVGLAGDRAGQQSLAGAGLARQQHALGDGRAQRPVLVRVAQEVDDLGQLGLDLVDAGDVGERRAWTGLGFVPLGLRPADPAQAAESPAGRGPAHEPDQQADEQQRRAEADQDLLQHRHRVGRLGVDRDVVAQQQLGQPVVAEGRPLGGEVGDVLAVAVRILLRAAEGAPRWCRRSR